METQRQAGGVWHGHDEPGKKSAREVREEKRAPNHWKQTTGPRYGKQGKGSKTKRMFGTRRRKAGARPVKTRRRRLSQVWKKTGVARPNDVEMRERIRGVVEGGGRCMLKRKKKERD